MLDKKKGRKDRQQCKKNCQPPFKTSLYYFSVDSQLLLRREKLTHHPKPQLFIQLVYS